MALSEKDVAEIVTRFNDGETPAALATAYSVTAAAISYHLKKRGAKDPDAAKVETNEDLGIGEEDSALNASADLAALLENPALKGLIDAAVAARLAQMGATAVAQTLPSTQTEDFKAFTATLAHLIEVNSMQQAGYIKPLSAAEVDRRANGLVEMRALLEQYEAAGTPPLYLLSDSFFECTNALEFQAGQQIRTYLPPAESFIPKNEQAERVHAAMMQWIGGSTLGIGEQVEAAMIAAKNLPPLVTGALNADRKAAPVQVVDAPIQDMGRKRMSGTIVPERHGLSMQDRLATGPTFVNAEAAA